MRELFLATGESTASSLVFRTSDDDGAEEFFLVVDESLRNALLNPEAPISAPPSEAESVAAAGSSDSTDDTADASHTEDSEDDTADTQLPEEPVAAAPVHSITDAPERELDPRLSAPLKMRPREIQERVRAGATVADIAEENGVTESRIEPFAHPVLLERARIAEMAKQSHPVRGDGPAKLTLWEILATAFATRGHDLKTAKWDAYRDASGQWIVRVKWMAGLSENSAEWALNLHATSSSTAEPRTPVAADLIDPEFIQPVRSLTSIGGSRYAEDFDDFEDEDTDGPRDTEDEPDQPSTRTGEDPKTEDIPVVEGSDEDLLQHPEPEQAPKSRRRKAVTPHWEDVLLGVRTNTKRPRK